MTTESGGRAAPCRRQIDAAGSSCLAKPPAGSESDAFPPAQRCKSGAGGAYDRVAEAPLAARASADAQSRLSRLPATLRRSQWSPFRSRRSCWTRRSRSWRSGDAVTTRRAIASTRQKSRRMTGAGPGPLARYRLAPCRREITFGRRSARPLGLRPADQCDRADRRTGRRGSRRKEGSHGGVQNRAFA